jgi:hypothetical protein
MGDRTRTGPSWPVLVLVTVTAIASAGVASAVWTTPGGGTAPKVIDPAVQLATVEEACEGWTDETGRTLAGDDDRCAGLTGWLSDAMTRTGKSPWMLWGDPVKLRTMCVGWLTEGPPPDLDHRDGVTWCDDLVAWMIEHAGEWRDRGGWEGWLPQPAAPPIGP